MRRTRTHRCEAVKKLKKLGQARSLTAVLLLAAAIAAPAGPAAAQVPITFELDRPGYVTLVIEDAEGRRVHNLLADTRFQAGRHTVWWDGYEEGVKQGKDEGFDVHRARVEPGKHMARGLAHDGLALKYRVSVQSPGKPPWLTADRSGAWLADHTPPSAVLHLPDGSPHGTQPQMLISAPTAEAGHSIIWVDMDGHKLWGGKIRGWRSGQMMATDQGEQPLDDYYAYAVVEDVHLYGLRRGSAEQERDMVDLLVKFEPPQAEKPVDEDAPKPHWVETLAMRDLAVHDGVVAISYPLADRLAVIDLKHAGGARQHEHVAIASPRGLAYDRQGRLYVVSGRQVLRFDQPNLADGRLGPSQVIVREGLEDPGRLLIDDAGQLFVADLGTSHQIKVFTSAGEHLRTIGQPGGPQLGRYDERRMARPAGMALDDRGRLWVAELEYGPKRVSRWDAETGEFDRAWYGPPKYGGGGHIDPRKPTRFFYSSGLQGVEFELDWENDSSRPRSIYWRAAESIGRAPDASIYLDGHHFLIDRFFGPAYFLAPSNHVYLWDEEAGRAWIVAAVGGFDRKGLEPFIRAHAERNDALAAKLARYEQQARHPAEIFVVWSDLNRDGQPQADEVQFHVTPGRRNAKPILTRELAIATTAAIYVPPPIRITEQGVPVWDLSRAERYTEQYDAASGDLLRADDGTFVFTMGGYTAPRVMRAFRGGDLVWHINGWGGPGRPNPIAEHPGQIINAQRNLGFPFTPARGEAGQMFLLNGWQGSLYLLTTDGLLVTDLGGDSRAVPPPSYPEAYPGMIVRDVSFKSEHFWPAVVQMEDGTIHVMAGKESSSVFELVGCETIRRIGPWPVEVRPKHVSELAELQIVPGEGRHIERTATVTLAERAPRVDGDLADWAGADWMTIDPRRGIEGAVQIHGDVIFAAWRTDDPKLLSNDGGDGWQYVFATGGGLDLMLRTDPKTDANDPAAGDVRLFVTRLGDPLDGPVLAVRFQQVGGEGRGEAVEYTSPVGAVPFESVEDVSPRVRLAQRAGQYELAAPFDVLGIDPPRPGDRARGDIGVLVSDGSDTHARLYWSNKATHMTTDIPTEAALQPRYWGTWRFDRE
jgi:hypothetical protein